MPPGLVTVTTTPPAAWAGVVAFSCVELTKETPEAALPPKETVAPLEKLDPLIVTVVPPALGPESGKTLVIAGGAAAYVKPLERVEDLPSAVVTTTLTVPAE